MKVLVTGATGLVGTELCLSLLQNGHEVVVTSRNKSKAEAQLGLPVDYIQWKSPDKDLIAAELLEGVDGVVHLMGEGIADKRWSKEVKDRLYSSRIHSAKNLIKSFKNCGQFPDVFITASGVGIYGDRKDEKLNEDSSLGSGFLAELCKDWESTLKLLPSSCRGIALRTGVVLSRKGGMLKRLSPMVQANVLGAIGSGSQWMPWIHVKDLVRLFEFCLNDSSIQGAINATAPTPVTNKELTQSLCKKANKFVGPPVPLIALKLMYGEMSSVMLESARVKSSRLDHFNFLYCDLDSALSNIYERPFAETQFEQRHWLPQKKNTLFPFFSDAKNLETITPPFLNFKVLEQSTPEIKEGTLIDYKLSLKGLPFKWRTLINEWEPPEKFVDTQLKGPYKTWHHQHLFEDMKGGTLMRDIVHYELSFNAITQHVAGPMVTSDVNNIFSYRRKVINEKFGDSKPGDHLSLQV